MSEFPKKQSVTIKAQSRESSPNPQPKTKKRDPRIWADKISLWVLGLNNQFGYVVVLTAAKDILLMALPEEDYAQNTRHCSSYSTGILLLILIVPALLVELLQTQIPKCFNSFVIFAIFLDICGYFMLAFGSEPFLAFIGVGLISLGFGVGDYELSKQSLLYKIKIGRNYKSGTEDALIGGSFYYAILRLCGVNMFYVFLSLIILPVLALLCFWFLLRSPVKSDLTELYDSEYSVAIFDTRPTLVLLEDKVEYILYLRKYYAPLGFVIFLQGLVNQGLYEFIYFHGNLINIGSQYRFYLCAYNFGVYACLVTKNLLLVRHVSICAVLQLALTCYFFCDAFVFFTGYLWIILLLVYVQGLITGVAFMSTIDRMLAKEPANYLDIAETVMKFALFIMLIFSGIADFGVHYFLSQTSEHSRP